MFPPPLEYDLTIYQGATFIENFVWKTPGGPVNMTGATARMQVRRSVSSPEALLSLTTENGRITLGAAGQITLNLNAVETAAINWKRGVYDIEVAFDGSVRRLVFGAIAVSQEVTRD